MTEPKKELTAFEKLYEVDCGKYTEKKNGLTYLSWTYAWKEFKKAHPDATYEIKHWEGRPYLADETLGYMVETSISAGGETHSMWLPVMDGANKAQKAAPYTYKVKKYIDKKWTGEYEDKTVEPATMFDINTSIMRCLVKNIAMFGLGLYIYAGEDLPELSETTIAEKQAEEIAAKIAKMKEKIKLMLDSLPPELDTSAFAKYDTCEDVEQLTAMGIALKKICATQGATDANN
jgi:hypothetical protein